MDYTKTDSRPDVAWDLDDDIVLTRFSSPTSLSTMLQRDPNSECPSSIVWTASLVYQELTTPLRTT